MGRGPVDGVSRRIAWLVPFLCFVAACGAQAEPRSGLTGLEGDVLVSAAASLADAFTEMESGFEDENPGVDVILNFAGSSALREQILEGAPADIYASANQANMDAVVAGPGTDGSPQIFATNSLQIVTPAGNPGGITDLDDFAREDLLIGLCAEGVPCGDFARAALANAGVVAVVDTDEADVRALLTKVEMGELDAAIVYVTDVAAAGDLVTGIDIPASMNVVAEYPIAVLSDAPNPDAARAFVEFVLSEEGQAILGENGFTPA